MKMVIKALVNFKKYNIHYWAKNSSVTNVVNQHFAPLVVQLQHSLCDVLQQNVIA